MILLIILIHILLNVVVPYVAALLNMENFYLSTLLDRSYEDVVR